MSTENEFLTSKNPRDGFVANLGIYLGALRDRVVLQRKAKVHNEERAKTSHRLSSLMLVASGAWAGLGLLLLGSAANPQNQDAMYRSLLGGAGAGTIAVATGAIGLDRRRKMEDVIDAYGKERQALQGLFSCVGDGRNPYSRVVTEAQSFVWKPKDGDQTPSVDSGTMIAEVRKSVTSYGLEVGRTL